MASEIVQNLRGTLSPDANVRIAAELQLSSVFATPEAAFALSGVALSRDLDISIRQISFRAGCVSLRKYINEHWSPYFPTFKGQPPSPEIKAQIRVNVLQGISDPTPKIRSLFAHILSTVAHSDWPDDYPSLLNDLIVLISSSSQDSVNGAMQVFVEFVKSDATDDQILPVLKQLLPILLAILKASDAYAPLTRTRVIQVFSQCIEVLYMVKEQYSEAVKEASQVIVPEWIAAFHSLLSSDPCGELHENDWSGIVLRNEAFKALRVVGVSFPATLLNCSGDLLNLSLAHLESLVPPYTRFYLEESDTPPSSPDEGPPASLPGIAHGIFDLITQLQRKPKLSGNWFAVESHLLSIIRVAFQWAQMTKDDEETWKTDASAFLDNEDEEIDSIGPRAAAFDLLDSLLESQGVSSSSAISHQVQEVLKFAENGRMSNSNEWWKPLEAALACCSANADALVDIADSKPGHTGIFQPQSILSDAIPNLLLLHNFPYLQGRSLIFASKFARLVPVQVALRYVELAIEVIESPLAPLPVKLCGVKAIKNLCELHDAEELVSLADKMARVLGPLLLIAEDETLVVVLEATSAVLKIRQALWLSADLASSITEAYIQAWSRNLKDPVVTSVLEDCFRALASTQNGDAYAVVLGVSLPVLCNAITNSKAEESWIQASAFEFATAIIAARSKTLAVPYIAATFAPVMFTCLQSTVDKDVLQAGVTCLTKFIQHDANQLLTWQDSNGHSGLDKTLAVISRLLDANEGESGGLFVGELVMRLLASSGDAILGHVPQLLGALVNRMATAKTATFTQSLIIPFTLLLTTKRDETLAFLENIAVNVEGRSENGLYVLLNTWCENAESIHGLWSARMSTIALCQVFLSQRPSIQQCQVKGDMLLSPETKDVIVTRSRAKKTPHRFTTIPFPLKVVKILLTELQSDGDAATITAAGAHDLGSDDGDEDWEDEDAIVEGVKGGDYGFLSDILDEGNGAFEDDGPVGPEYDDLTDFPVSTINMKVYVTDFLKDCRTKNANEFATIIDQLNVEETLVLQRALGN